MFIGLLCVCMCLYVCVCMCVCAYARAGACAYARVGACSNMCFPLLYFILYVFSISISSCFSI